MELRGKQVKIIDVVGISLLSDGHTCTDILVEDEEGKKQVVHIKSPEPFTVVPDDKKPL